MKRGQITLFVIIGMVLLFVFVMFLLLSRTNTASESRALAQNMVTEFIESSSISQYASTCLQRVATEGLELISRQGGVIYDTQGGLTPTDTNFAPGFHYYNYLNEYNVSYSLIGVSGDKCISYNAEELIDVDVDIPAKEKWEYPVENLHFDRFQSRFWSEQPKGCLSVDATKDLFKSGYLGYSRLPFLCTIEAAEDYGDLPNFLVNICRYKYQESAQAVENGYTQEHPSIESQLESYVSANFPKCFNTSDYESFGDEVTPYPDKTNTTILFAYPEGVHIKAAFPFEVAIKGERPIVEFVDFQYTVDVNVLSSYYFIYELLWEMARNPFFDLDEALANNFEGFDHYKDSLEIHLIKGECALGEDCNPLSSSYDDILTVQDTSTHLEGEDFVFYLGLKQRKPVLDYISSSTQHYEYPPGEKIDFLFYHGETMVIRPRGMDPNYDDYNITFLGWKETTDNYLDLDHCRDSDTCSLADYSGSSLSTSSHPNVDLECCRLLGCTISNYDECLLDVNYEPHILSQLFEASGYTEISYEIKESDLGVHEFTVIIEDEHGAKDYQTIRVLVYDSPLAILSTDNQYDDVKNTSASIEDIYFLSAESSQASVFSEEDALSYFVYNISFENWTLITDNSSIIIPYENETNEPYTFEDILPRMFKNTTFYEWVQDEFFITRSIGLYVRQVIQGDIVESPAHVVDVNISECLPHGYVPGSGFGFDGDKPLTYYQITPYEEDGKPYYQVYSSNDREAQFAAPNVCCQPLETAQLQVGDLLGNGKFGSAGSLCYQNKNYQTCYPPKNDDVREELLLKFPVIDIDGFVIEYNDEDYEELYGLIQEFPPYDEIPDAYEPLLWQYLNYNPNNGNHLGWGNGNSRGQPKVLNDGINDIYNLTHEQSCSGNRGNTCSGEINLSWGLEEEDIVECADLDDVFEQYARCAGPGISTTDSELDAYVGDDINILLDKPFTSNTYECMGNDATQAFNVSMTCQNFSNKQSFEKNVLKINENNNYGLGTQTGKNIADGYCAGPTPAHINNVNGHIQIDTRNNPGLGSKGPFNCKATCGETGCNYSKVSDCECSGERPGDSTCEGAQVSNLYVDGYEQFVCAPNGEVCNDQCRATYSDVGKEACWCDIRGSSTPSTNSFTYFRNYFSGGGSWSNSNPVCCGSQSSNENNAYIVRGGTLSTGANACFNDVVYRDGMTIGGYPSSYIVDNGGIFLCSKKCETVTTIDVATECRVPTNGGYSCGTVTTSPANAACCTFATDASGSCISQTNYCSRPDCCTIDDDDSGEPPHAVYGFCDQTPEYLSACYYYGGNLDTRNYCLNDNNWNGNSDCTSWSGQCPATVTDNQVPINDFVYGVKHVGETVYGVYGTRTCTTTGWV